MASYTITQIPAPRTPVIDETTGLLSREWFRWFNNVNNIIGEGLGVIAVINGGTGQSTYTNGQLLIGNNAGNTLSKNTLTQGAGIGITNGPGSIAIANTGVLSIIAGAGILVDQATGDVTVDNDGVLSFSGGATGLTPTTATTGDVVLAGTLDVNNGGTGQTSYTNGQLLIGNTTGNTLAKATLTAGANITIVNGPGTITISAAAAPSGVTATITTAKLTVAGANGSMTFTNGILTAQTPAT
jgi:hypothetical protein